MLQGLKPVMANRGHLVAWHPDEECRLIEKGVAHPAVSPIQERDRSPFASCIAGVEISVDERVRHPAGCNFLEARWQFADESVEGYAVQRVELGACPVDDVCDRDRQCRTSPVRQSQGEQLVDPADPLALQVGRASCRERV